MRHRFRRAALRCGTALLAVTFAAGCATSPEPPVEVPSAEEARRLKSAGYELPPVIDTESLVTPEQLEGPGHRIAGKVYSDDRWHVYTIEADAGTFHAWGDDALDARLREVAAIQAIDELRTTEGFAAAAGAARSNPLVAQWSLVTEPVETAVGVPQEVWDGAHAKSGDRAARRELSAFGNRKREIAAEFGVDPYSSNAALQRDLNALAWAVYAGGLQSMFVPEGTTVGDDRMLGILRQYSPRELERLNRIELRVMGVPKPLADEFLRNPWYSPRYATMLVADLSALSRARDRAKFIEVAVAANSENDAHYFQRCAELMRRYDASNGRVEAIVAVAGQPLGVAENATLVVPHPADFAVWSEPTAAFADAVTRELPADLQPEATRLLLAGAASPTARSQLESRGIAVVEHAFHALRTAPAVSDAGAE